MQIISANKLDLTGTVRLKVDVHYLKKKGSKERKQYVFLCVFLWGKAWKVAFPFMKNYMPHCDQELMETIP